MKLSYTFLTLLAVADATNLKYKQHGSPVDKTKRQKKKVREYGNAVMKRFGQGNSSDEVSFKVSKKDLNVKLSFLSDSDDIDYSVATPNENNFKKLDKLESEGNPGNKGKEKFGGKGNGKELDARGIKLKRNGGDDEVAGEIKVKASLKSGNNGKNPKQRLLSDTTTIAIMNPGSVINVCFESLNDVHFVGEEATLRVGLCDIETDMVYPNAVSSGTLNFSDDLEDDSGEVVFGASGEDGWSEVSFTPSNTGGYAIRIDIEAMTEDNETVERQVLSAIEVLDKEIEDIQSVAFDVVDNDGEVEIEMTLNANLYDEFSPSDDTTYHVSADIVASDGMEPFTASGLADLRTDNTLKLTIQPEWFGGATGDYSVDYLKISTSGGTSTLLVMEGGIQVHSTLPNPFTIPDHVSGRRLQETNEERMLRMTMGVKPQMESQNEETLGNLRSRQLNPTGKVILSHGYCSGSNPWESDLKSKVGSKAVIFKDFDQSRSHNDFAILLRDLGDQEGRYDGCGIIAHSQGGAAALHLYTYYWSCLDYATGGGSRMIQSVGTPYQGTALAGNLAVLGQIFGVGCGASYDMTYSGASNWLSGIPSWARSEVNYYTTSFKDRWWAYDYCHIATDLLLNDPDDGTTEKSKGQLSGGINRGHRTGQCHTSGMRDLEQTKDQGRNQDMANNARY